MNENGDANCEAVTPTGAPIDFSKMTVDEIAAMSTVEWERVGGWWATIPILPSGWNAQPSTTREGAIENLKEYLKSTRGEPISNSKNRYAFEDIDYEPGGSINRYAVEDIDCEPGDSIGAPIDEAATVTSANQCPNCQKLTFKLSIVEEQFRGLKHEYDGLRGEEPVCLGELALGEKFVAGDRIFTRWGRTNETIVNISFLFCGEEMYSNSHIEDLVYRVPKKADGE